MISKRDLGGFERDFGTVVWRDEFERMSYRNKHFCTTSYLPTIERSLENRFFENVCTVDVAKDVLVRSMYRQQVIKQFKLGCLQRDEGMAHQWMACGTGWLFKFYTLPHA